MIRIRFILAAAMATTLSAADTKDQERDNAPPPGFRALFIGRDFTGWRVPAGDNGHCKVLSGTIDFDVTSLFRAV